jgi:uncharacterized protein (DUF4415 family)
MKNKIVEEFALKGGDTVHDTTDWNAVTAMSEEQVMKGALSDPDAQPSNEEQRGNARRVWDMPGNSLYEKLQAVADENKRLITVRYDPDVIAYFRAQGKGYQTLMNKVLRTYMERQLSQEHA